MIKLSVIIVNYNVQYFLKQCLLSVQASCKNIVAEIIVVDNNSKDKSCKMLKDKFPKISLIENKINVGFAKANNQGVDKAKGRYVLILNPDTVLAEDTIDQVINFSAKQKKLGAIGVRFIDGSGNFLPECKRNIPTVRIANQKLAGKTDNYYANKIAEKEISKVAVLSGAFMLLKREVYIKLGGFDETYFMFGEDIDLSYKLMNSGYQNFYYGKATMIHYKGESTIKDRNYLENFYGAMQIFYKKHYKVNTLFYWFSNVVVKMMIVFKNFTQPSEIQVDNKTMSFLYIGDNQNTLKKLKKQIKTVNVETRKTLSLDCKDFDLVIFDNAFLSFKEIINNIYQLRSTKISKRIIPKNCNFLIGSDTSVGRGKIVEF